MGSIEDLKKDIRGVLTSAKHGIPARKFFSEFQEATMEDLNPQKYGFNRLHDLMVSIPDTVKVEHSVEGVVYVAIQNEATAGVAQLVAKQQSKKRLRTKTGRVSGKPYFTRHGSSSAASSSKSYSQRLPSRVVAGPNYTKMTRGISSNHRPQSGQNMAQNNAKGYPNVNDRTGDINGGNQRRLPHHYQQLPSVTATSARMQLHTATPGMSPNNISTRNSDAFSSMQPFPRDQGRREQSIWEEARAPAVLYDRRSEPHYQPDPYEDLYDYVEEIEGEERVPSVELEPNVLRRMNDEHALEENQNNRRHYNDEPQSSNRYNNSVSQDIISGRLEALELERNSPPLFFELPLQSSLDASLGVQLLAYYVYMHTPSKFYVHLADEEKIQEIADRCDRLSQSAPDVGNKRLVDGQLLLYKCDFDGSWSRAEMLPNDHVLMVDFGSKEKYNPARAKYLPRELAEYPVMARQCSLADIQPANGAWSRAANEEMINRCQDVELYLTIQELRFASDKQKNPTLVVDVLIVETVDDPVQLRKNNRNAKSLASIMVEARFAHFNANAASHHRNVKALSVPLTTEEKQNNDDIIDGEASKITHWLSKMYGSHEDICSISEEELEDLDGSGDRRRAEDDYLTRGRRKVPAINLDSASLNWELLRPPLPQSHNLREYQRKSSNETKCVISHVDPVGNLFLKVLPNPADETGRGDREWTGFDYLDQLLLQINTYKYLHDVSNIISQPNVGQLYVAFDNRTQLFSRGIVSSVESDHFLVLFVDQGYSCEVSLDMLRDPEPFQPAFSKLPQQVANYQFADVDYDRDIHEEYLQLLIDKQRVLTCTQADDYDSNNVNLVLPDGLLLSDVLYSLELTQREDYEAIERLSRSSSYLVDKSTIFLNSRRPFHSLHPCDYLKHGQTASFTVIALNAGRHMKIVLLELYEKYFAKLKRELTETSKGDDGVVALSSLHNGKYFLVRSKKVIQVTRKPVGKTVEEQSTRGIDFHRCKLSDNILDLEFVFYDIDTGDTVFAKRSDIFTLPEKFYGSEFPLVTWDASFLLSGGEKLPMEMVGRQLKAQVVYPTKDCLHLVNTTEDCFK